MKIDPKSRPLQIAVALMLFLPTLYLGLGYVIASSNSRKARVLRLGGQSPRFLDVFR